MTMGFILLMMFVGTDVDAAFFDQQPLFEKEEVAITVLAGEYRPACSGIWNIAGMRTRQGVSFRQGLIDAAMTLEQTRSGKTEFLEYFMHILKESGGVGERFRCVGRGDPLSVGVGNIEDDLVWSATFSESNNIRPDDFCYEVVRLHVLGKCAISGYVGRSLAKRKRC